MKYCFVDCSGSMVDVVDKVVSTMKQVSSENFVGTNFIYFNTVIEKIQFCNKNEIPIYDQYQVFGGSIFSCVEDYIIKNNINIDDVTVITDGIFSESSYSKIIKFIYV